MTKKKQEKFLVIVDECYDTSEEAFDQILEALTEQGVCATVYPIDEDDIFTGGTN